MQQQVLRADPEERRAMEAKRDEALAVIYQQKVFVEKLDGDDDIDITSQGDAEFYTLANMRKRKVTRRKCYQRRDSTTSSHRND